MSNFIDALKGKNKGHIPVWFMRQAGRYLPEYRSLREKYSLKDLFFTPKLAAEITLQPIRRFSFDAAIVFSDITAVAPAMGFDLVFSEGPVTKRITNRFDESLLDPIAEAVALIKAQSEVPLIGFCGGPFTISKYVEAPLDEITAACSIFLKKQIQAGCDVVQIFDTWAGSLDGQDWVEKSFKPIKKIVESLSVPSIVFMKKSGIKAPLIAQMAPTAIGIDESSSLKEVRKKVGIPLQGNLDPEILLGPMSNLEEKVREIKESMNQDPGFIFNLAHGIKPSTPIAAVEKVLQIIRS
jgi:uroporphyrinogen decarboxylase